MFNQLRQSKIISKVLTPKSSKTSKPNSVATVKLNNGKSCPIIGLGTWQSPLGEVEQAVKDAIDIGYRHIDCAFVYGNENEVGNAISAKIASGAVKREDLFIVSKLWNTFHDPSLVRGALEKTLKNLKVDYLDLYLIHWPMGWKESGDNLFPQNDKAESEASAVDYVDTWKAMESLVTAGLAKSIGVSNFNSKQIDRVWNVAKIKPVMNQIECHPFLTQKKLIAHCRAKDIHITSYSPLGSPNRPWAKPGEAKLLEEPNLLTIAKKYNKSPAQILIRYQVQVGNVVIPKSTSKNRIASNFDVFDFELSAQDLAAVEAFNVNGRLFPMSTDINHQHYPFAIEF